MSRGRAWLVAAALGAALAGRAQSADDGARRGWHFYDDPAAALVPVHGAPVAPVADPVKKAAPPDAPPEVALVDTMQKRLEELRKVAIVSPTDDNMLRYLRYERMVVEQASRFADAARRVSWQVPELDAAANGRPHNQSALKIYELNERQEQKSRLAGLARDHVLMFFFRSDCPYCHALAPVMAALERAHGIQVVPVSLDGAGLPQYPAPRADGGVAARMGVRQVPAVFLAEPGKGVIKPVAYGVVTGEELEQRIATLAADDGRGASAVRELGAAP